MQGVVNSPAQQVDAPLSPEELGTELRKFEGYRDKFEGDIRRLEGRRARLQEDVEEYGTLVRNVEKLIADGTTSLESRVDIGCDVSVAARVPDARHIFVAVGLGFHVEAPLADVASLVAPRREFLASSLMDVERQLSDARACAAAFDNSLKMLREGEVR